MFAATRARASTGDAGGDLEGIQASLTVYRLVFYRLLIYWK